MKWILGRGGGASRGTPEDEEEAQADREAGADQDDRDSSPGLVSLPAMLLERHGARVLDPVRAAAVSGVPRPRPTVYRAATLLVPGFLLANGGFIEAVNDVLRQVGLSLVPPERDLHAGLDVTGADQEVLEALTQLPRAAVLVPLPGYHLPVKVDAWTALQALRAAAGRGKGGPNQAESPEQAGGPEQAEVRLDAEQVELIGLEHLLTGSTVMTGSPSGATGGGISGSSGNGAGGVPGINDSYQFSGDPRTPVTLLADPPPRKSGAECVTAYGRRPVVAVLDTGVRAHPWLGVTQNGPSGGSVETNDEIQAEIRAEGEWANLTGAPRQVIAGAWDRPATDNRLIGELDEASGHFTFIAGILRQAVPDATVLAVRVMGSDDIVYESDVICALGYLALRMAIGQPGDLLAEVDVISLSFGYYDDRTPAQMASSGLWLALKVLIGQGVAVTAAAGNFASRRRCYPAAFALEPLQPGETPVLSVGALNVNGTKAMFSNDGHWVTAWAAGVHVVSTYPVDIDGSRTPDLRVPADRVPAERWPRWPRGREALDPDDFRGGFAVWSGSSFSAPYAAAVVVNTMLEDTRRPGGALRLDHPGKAARLDRARTAHANLPPFIR